jgi:hypothetical protein
MDDGLCDRADEVMKKVGVRRMIMGHTPDFQVTQISFWDVVSCLTPFVQKIVSRCDGKIIIIDTGRSLDLECDALLIDISIPGISHAYGGALSALSITYSLVPISSDDGSERWKEEEVIVAMYEDRQEVLAMEERAFHGKL